MNEHRYILEPYKGMNTRYHCPSCQQKDKTLSLYINTETGEHIHPSVGRCNREINCGYHYTPKQYFQDSGIITEPKQYAGARAKCSVVTPPHISLIPVEIFKASLKGYETNNFVQFLIQLFGVEITEELISKYFIGTSKHWNGATVFWQIDFSGKLRTGKIMLYNATTGKRVKEPFNYITWVHKALKQSDFELKQCLFGEHLLHDRIKPVAIVESEKTALIASVYLPQFIWLAVGSLTNLNAEKCSILKGRTVILFPDLNGFEKWSSKAKELSHLATFTVSDLLEHKATEQEKKQGFDIADYLTKFDFIEFSQPENLTKLYCERLTNDNIENLTKPNIENFTKLHIEPIITTEFLNPIEQINPKTWEQDIIELEKFFAGIALPTSPIKLNQCSTITDLNIFIESHFAIVKTNNGKQTFLPYLNRLKELKIKTQSSLII